MAILHAATDLTTLLWFIAQHDIDTEEAFPASPLLQQALDERLVDWPSEEDGPARLRLSEPGRSRLGLPPLISTEEKAKDWLRSQSRRALSRFFM
jgi:hypothetical protein